MYTMLCLIIKIQFVDTGFLIYKQKKKTIAAGARFDLQDKCLLGNTFFREKNVPAQNKIGVNQVF